MLISEGTFQLAMAGEPMFNGAPVTVPVRSSAKRKVVLGPGRHLPLPDTS